MAQFGSKSNGKIFCVWRVRIVRSEEFGVWSGGIAFCDDCIKENLPEQSVILRLAPLAQDDIGWFVHSLKNN